jgi:hypothetical protein
VVSSPHWLFLPSFDHDPIFGSAFPEHQDPKRTNKIENSLLQLLLLFSFSWKCLNSRGGRKSKKDKVKKSSRSLCTQVFLVSPKRQKKKIIPVIESVAVWAFLASDASNPQRALALAKVLAAPGPGNLDTNVHLLHLDLLQRLSVLLELALSVTHSGERDFERARELDLLEVGDGALDVTALHHEISFLREKLFDV